MSLTPVSHTSQEPQPAAPTSWGDVGYRVIAFPFQAVGVGLTLAGRGVREIVHPIVFTATGYSVKVAKEENHERLLELMRITGSRHLSCFVGHIAPPLGRSKAQNMEGFGAFQWLIHCEEDLIADITNHVITLIFRNLTLASVKSDEEKSFPLKAIVRKVASVFETHMPAIVLSVTENGEAGELIAPFTQEMGELLYRNNPSEIPAPYPVHKMVFSDIETFFGASFVTSMIRFCHLTPLSEKLEKSGTGKCALDVIDIALKNLEPILLSIIKNNKDSVIEWLMRLYPDESRSKPAIRIWFETQVAHVIEENKVAPIYPRILLWIRSILTHGALKLIEENKTDELLEILSDFIERRICHDRMIDRIFSLLDWESGTGFGFTPAVAIGYVPTFKYLFHYFLEMPCFIKIFTDTFSWCKERLDSEASFNETEKKVASLIGVKCITHIEEFLNTRFTSKITRTGVNPRSRGELKSWLTQLLSSERRIAELNQAIISYYVESAVMLVMKRLKAVFAEHEARNHSELTLKLLDKVLVYFRYHITALNKQHPTQIPRCNVLARELLEFLKITKDDLPIPESYRTQLWEYLTDTLVPDILQQLLDTHLTGKSIKTHFVNILKMQEAESPTEAAANRTAPDTIRQHCTVSVEQLITYFNLSLVEYLDPNITTKIGHQMADMIYTKASQMPMSALYEQSLNVALEQLQKENQEVPEDDFMMVSRDLTDDEIDAYVGRFLERQIRLAIASGVQRLGSGIKKGVRKGVDRVFQAASCALMSRGTGLVDNFSHQVSAHFLPQVTPTVPMVRVGSMEFAAFGDDLNESQILRRTTLMERPRTPTVTMMEEFEVVDEYLPAT